MKKNLELYLSILSRHVSQSTLACLIAMTHGELSTLTLNHWKIALTTGLGAGFLAIIMGLGHLKRFQGTLIGVAIVSFISTFFSDIFAHSGDFKSRIIMALITACGAVVLSILMSLTPIGKFIENLAKEPPHNQH
jgi:hypothetical protein